MILAASLLNAAVAAAPRKAALGAWGGEHVRLEVTRHGARLEFDCAHGSTDKPIALDGEGRFDVKGVFVREHHGPIRVGREPKSQPASYSGKVQGKNMTLWVTLTDSNEPVGTYSLTHGQEARVRKCR
jgi:hypothetical protein